MKRLIWILILLLPVVSGWMGCSDAEEPEFPDLEGLDPGQGRLPEQEFRVMTFNVRVNSTDNDGSFKDWNVRKKAVAAVFKDKRPTLCGVQEAYLNGQWDYLKETLADEGYECIGKPITDWSEPPAKNGQVVGIFYRPSEVSLVRWGVFSLSETPDEPLETPALGASYVRGATWAEFELNENKRHVFMLNTHLDTKSDAVRKKELEIILARIAFYNKKNLPTFMTADFNANAQNSIFYDTVVRDSYLLAREQAPVGDLNTPTNNHYGTTSASYIDHIWYSNFSLKIDAYYVVTQQYFDDVPYVSDHWPSYAVFRY